MLVPAGCEAVITHPSWGKEAVREGGKVGGEAQSTNSRHKRDFHSAAENKRDRRAVLCGRETHSHPPTDRARCPRIDPVLVLSQTDPALELYFVWSLPIMSSIMFWWCSSSWRDSEASTNASLSGDGAEAPKQTRV